MWLQQRPNVLSQRCPEKKTVLKNVLKVTVEHTSARVSLSVKLQFCNFLLFKKENPTLVLPKFSDQLFSGIRVKGYF